MFKQSLLAATLVASIFGLAASDASATLLSPMPKPAVTNDNYVSATTVVKKKVVTNRNGKRVVKTATVYNPAKHGPRYRHRTGRYIYYYNGYYYSRPWWTVAVPGLSISIN